MAFVKYPAGTKIYDGKTLIGVSDGNTEYNNAVVSTSPGGGGSIEPTSIPTPPKPATSIISTPKTGATQIGNYPKGTELIRDDGVRFTSDGNTVYGKSYKLAGQTSSEQIKPPTSSISQEEYYIKPGESLYDYNKRIATRRGETNFSVPNVADKGATSVTYNLQAEIAKINTEANKTQQADYASLTDEVGSTVDLSSSAKLTERLLGMLEGDRGERPPSLVETFNQQRQALGVGALEDELAGKDAEIAKLDADYTSTLSEEEARPVPLGQVRKRQGAVELAYNRQKRDLQVERQYVADRLDSKLGIVSTMVNLTGQDYQLATQKYDADFNKAIQITNLVRGIEEDQKADEEKRADNARANVQVMYNLLKEGNVSYDKLSQSEKANITKMEVQAGLPSGFVKYISETIEDPAVSFLSAYTDANGKRIQPIATVDPKTGAVKVNNISLGRAKAEDGDTPDKKLITQATLNKLAASGVPEVVAVDIQRSLNSGKDEAVIRAHLKSQLGAVTAQKYMDAFNSVMKGSSGLVEIPE